VAATELPVISPRERGCCTPAATPGLTAGHAVELAALVKAIADPTRLRIVDALRAAAPEALCQCELVPLFAMSQPALAKHLRVLSAAGVVGSEKRGLWTFYFLLPGAMEDLTAWLS
jgi:ArsR family transcriptional regulator, arsenate/arsenite/antimonite-responsive transcriptional repressor